jgi:hypothetical protein
LERFASFGGLQSIIHYFVASFKFIATTFKVLFIVTIMAKIPVSTDWNY